VIIPYFPLIFGILSRLKEKDFYQEMKTKFITTFSIFMFFLCLRLYLYFDFKLAILIYRPDNQSIFSPIAFYVTEIVITLLSSYLLFSVSQNETVSNASIKRSFLEQTNK
jgi:uncharacterized membrane protein YesL